jgi:small subunit ribosomal protein S17
MAEETENSDVNLEAPAGDVSSEAPASSAPDETSPSSVSAPVENEASDASSESPAAAAAGGGARAGGQGQQPAEVLTPKQRRARQRAAKFAASPAREPRTPQQRQAERDAERKRKAIARRRQRERARAKYKAAEHERVATPAREHTPGNQKMRRGMVVSDKPDRTITVRIDVTRRHRRYEKVVRTSSTVYAHDERNDAHIGDIVVVRECRPLSRSKRWRLVEVMERAR